MSILYTTKKANKFTVRVGSAYRDKSGSTFDVSEVHVHSDYTPDAPRHVDSQTEEENSIEHENEKAGYTC